MAVSTNGMVPVPRRFRGKELVRSVIARPLLERIRCEAAMTESLLAKFPAFSKRYNAAVFLNPEFPGGRDAALMAVRDMVNQADLDARPPGRKPAKVGKPSAKIAEDIAPASIERDVIDELLGMNASMGGPIRAIWPSLFDVIIDINLKFQAPAPSFQQEPGSAFAQGHAAASSQPKNPISADPRVAAKGRIEDYIAKALSQCGITDPHQGLHVVKTALSNQYVFARLEGRVIMKLVDIDREQSEQLAQAAGKRQEDTATRAIGGPPLPPHIAASIVPPASVLFRAIYQIWPDFDLQSCIFRSLRTIKADAAQNSFNAYGESVTWAVLDSGIDVRHPHFNLHKNIDAASPFHGDFTSAPLASPLTDEYGHGTHVAGIIAGEQTARNEIAVPDDPYEAEWRLKAAWREREASTDSDEVHATSKTVAVKAIAGIAPKCKLVSLKVLNKFGTGKASNVIAAIAHIQLINGHGRDLKIHGVNLSLGHNFDPEWFACGHSPLCVEVNRLVKSGVVVVIAAGNTGYGTLKTQKGGDSNTCLDLTINDPGNAENAITVGSTHRESPHQYGVSYFSSKGPTGDGRLKPDLIAPGERIVSCAAAGSKLATATATDDKFAYYEMSGTSMAAPHVSGAIAAFLSIRNEFIGEAEKVKAIFTSAATDLGRERHFQGAGLVDLLRAIQSV